MYYRKVEGGEIIYLLPYVDAILLAGKKKLELSRLKAGLSCRFEIKDMGPESRILDMDIFRKRVEQKLVLAQRDYLKKDLTNFGLLSFQAVSTPLT